MRREHSCRDLLKRAVRIFIYLVVSAVVPASVFWLIPTSVHYQISERYEFTARQPGADVRLAVMLPKSGPYQTVNNLRVSWAGEAKRTPYESVEVMMLEGTIGPEGELEATLTYHVSLPQGRLRWQADSRAAHTEPENGIESDAPILAAQAQAMRADGTREHAYRIFTFTAQHLSWPVGTRMGASQSALQAYRAGVGVCGDFADVMTALCRAAGIPAKSMSGLSLPMLMPPFTTRSRSWMHPGGAHAWAEVYTGNKWEMADPSLASNFPLARFWFGRGFGQYLSYGEQRQQDRAYEKMRAWAEKGGEIVGAMSAPLKFSAAIRGPGATVHPVVSVKKLQDARWFAAAGVYLALLRLAQLLERHLRGTE